MFRRVISLQGHNFKEANLSKNIPVITFVVTKVALIRLIARDQKAP